MNTAGTPTGPSGLALTGKVAGVTGGAQGIGRGCALALAREGVTVVTLDIDAEATAEVERLAQDLPGEVIGIVGDVREADDLRALLDTAARSGGVDILVNNAAGLLGTTATTTLEVSEDDWSAVVDFNLRPVFLGATMAAKDMIARGAPGSIINIGASVAMRASPRLAAYGAAKAGVHQLTQTLAVELGSHGIRVNSVAPVYTETPATENHSQDIRELTSSLIPLGRVARPDDMAGAVLFLASHLASFVTGQTIVVDGGFLCQTGRPFPRGAGRPTTASVAATAEPAAGPAVPAPPDRS